MENGNSNSPAETNVEPEPTTESITEALTREPMVNSEDVENTDNGVSTELLCTVKQEITHDEISHEDHSHDDHSHEMESKQQTAQETMEAELCAEDNAEITDQIEAALDSGNCDKETSQDTVIHQTDNDPIQTASFNQFLKAKEQICSPPPNRFLEIRTNVESKTNLLSNAWNDLYSMLGEYKAELFSMEAAPQKYEGISDINNLRNTLIGKDNQLRDKELEIQQKNDEIMQYRAELDQSHQFNEQSQLDLSVKDSLLKKYQEDLLAKESSLMTVNTKNTRLENRLRMLESKAGDSHSEGPPRKLMRPQMSPIRGPTALGRFTPGRPGFGAGRILPGSAGRLQSAVGRVGLQSPGLNRRRPPAATMARSPVTPVRQQPRPPPQPPQQQQPVVCIEVDDDDEIQEIQNVAAQNIPQTSAGALTTEQSVYMDAWPEGDDASNLVQDTSEQDNVNQALMMQSDSQQDFSGQDDMSVLMPQEGEPWPIQMSPAMPSMRQMATGMGQSPGNKRFECLQCARRYTRPENLRHHIKVVHLGIKQFACPECDYRTGQKCHLKGHVVGKHGKTIEQYQIHLPDLTLSSVIQD